MLQAGTPLEDARLVVVLLHGRGGSAEDILGLATAFALPDVAYLAPEAQGRTLYLCSFMEPREANEPFLSSALAKVESIVQLVEQAGVKRERIVIAGFSQGACLSTEFVASHPAHYGGLIAFTGGLIGPPGTIDSGPYTGGELAGTPIFLGSGDPDPHVSVEPCGRVCKIVAVHGRQYNREAISRSLSHDLAGGDFGRTFNALNRMKLRVTVMA